MKRILPLLLAMALLFSLAAAEKVLYVKGTTSDRVHLRAAASADAKSLGLYFNGTAAVQLAAAQNGWVKVQIGAETGYMVQECLSDADSVASAAPVYIVSNEHSTWVNLRAEPTTQSTAKAQFDNGTRVELLGETADGWSYVRADLLTGYMMTDMLAPAENQSGGSFATGEEIPVLTTIVGQSRENDYIHHYVADNGQDIFFTAIEERPSIMKQDVNFDGRDDLVIFTSMGSSNLFCRFYVFDDGMYVPAMQNGLVVELVNYHLYPGKNIVLSRSNDGYAGALFAADIYRWDETGTQLQHIRQAVSDDLTKTEFTSDRTLITTIYSDILHVKIRDFTAAEYEGTIIYEADFTHDVLDADWFDDIDAILWQGL